MRPKVLYAGLGVIGTILPYWQFSRFLREDGLNLRELLRLLFANGASGFFAMDVLVSSVVLVAFMRTEAIRVRIRLRWAPVLALVTVGVSLALPLYLYLREMTRDGPAATRPPR
jgi:hypothetical protein